MGLLEMYQSFKGHLLKELQVFFDLHRTLYSIVVIALLNTALCRFEFSVVSFRKLAFRLPMLSLNQNIKICVIMVCNFDV